MAGHPLFEVSAHGFEGFPVQRNVIGPDFINLGPALAPSSLQRKIHVCKGLVDLCIDLSWDGFNPLVREPTTFLSLAMAIQTSFHGVWNPTLAGTFYLVSNANSLAIVIVSLVGFSHSGVIEVFEVSHFEGK